MSHTQEESRSASGSETESSGNDIDNSYESNDTDSHFDEDDEGGINGFSLDPSDRLIGGSIILRIDPSDARFQQHVSSSVDDSSHPGINTSFESHVCFTSSNDNSSGITGTTTGFLTTLPPAEHSVSVATSVSETASENTSIRAVMGDTPVTTANNVVVAEEDIDNSSQASLADSDAERVRRIHNTIFSSLEHDLAELVRIREATIQFLENGTRPSELANDSSVGEGESSSNNLQLGDDANDENANVPNPDPDQSESEQEPVLLRERLTFQSLPCRNINVNGPCNRYRDNLGERRECRDPNTITMNGRSYTPTAKFDDVPEAKPAKPYLEVGLSNCEDKAVAARKVFDKLQYGNPEDESACFMRRFWRETSTVVENTMQEDQLPITIDAASLAQRTASLQASLEEAFGGLRLRLQQVQRNHNARVFESQESQTDRDEGEVEGESGVQSTSSHVAESESSQNEAEASAYFQSWDEETSIMNNPLNYDIWNELEQENDSGTSFPSCSRVPNHYHTCRANVSTRSGPSHSGTTTVGVGTDEGNEGAEDDDEDTHDEPGPNSFRATQNPSTTPRVRRRALSPGTREFLEEIGLSEEIGRDILNLYTSITERNLQNSSNLNDPEPLYREQDENANFNEGLDSDSNDDENISHIPLASTEECPLFIPNPNDDCSTRVYLDLESELNLSNSHEEGTQP